MTQRSAQPVCSVSWCIGVPKLGQTKCPIHISNPNYKAPAWQK